MTGGFNVHIKLEALTAGEACLNAAEHDDWDWRMGQYLGYASTSMFMPEYDRLSKRPTSESHPRPCLRMSVSAIWNTKSPILAARSQVRSMSHHFALGRSVGLLLVSLPRRPKMGGRCGNAPRRSSLVSDYSAKIGRAHV